MTSPFVKDEILNQVLWTILSKIQLSSLPKNARTFTNITLNDFDPSLDGKTKDNIEAALRQIADGGGAKLNLFRNNMVALTNFDISALETLARDNMRTDVLAHFISGIKLWNTDKGQPISNICYTAFPGRDSRDIKSKLTQVGLLIGDSSKSYTPHNYFVWEAITDSPTDYARRLFGIPVFNERNPPSGLYVTYPDIYLTKKDDHDNDRDH